MVQNESAGKRLSILLISPDPSAPGGVSAVVEMLKSRLGHCQVTSLHVGGQHKYRENFFVRAKRLFTVPLTVFRLVGRMPVDVVHINPTLNYKSGVRDGLILLALRLRKFRRILVYFHGWENGVATCIRRMPGLRQVTAWLLSGADRILVLAPEFKSSLEQIGINKNNIFLTRTMFDGTSLKITKETHGENPRRTILFMSRLEREKGVHELLSAFARLAAEFPDVDLVMAGDGTRAAYLHAAAATYGLGARICFTGWVRGAEKYRLLSGCSIFVLPAYMGSPEGMPVALLEAMAAGKPLLATKAGGIAHIIREPENGIVLGTVTTDSLEVALRRLLCDPAYCVRAGKRNADYVWSRFEATQVTAEIEAFYNDIAFPDTARRCTG
jgi:glycosyltransferase involved in cell wall biosynthesis